MPPWMVNVANVNPVTWAVKAMEIALWKGGEFSELSVPLTVVSAAGIFLFCAAVFIFRENE
jgi:hypothetical protein